MGWLTEILGLGSSGNPEVHSITDENFKEEVLRSELPVLLDVWSDGCGPCRMLEPVVLELAKKYRGRLKVAEVNVARAPKAVARLGVTGTPTVLYFHRSNVKERVVGYRALHYHRDYLEKELFPSIAPGEAPTPG